MQTLENKPVNYLHITLKNQIFLERKEVNELLIDYLRRKLIFINSEYLLKKKIGKSVYKTEKYFKLLKENKNKIAIPRGFAKQLIEFCQNNNFLPVIIDERNILKKIKFTAGINLYNYQEKALTITEKKDFGVLVAPSGSGKTVMGLELIVRKSQPALILVHRKQLLEQWLERIQAFLKIPKKDIGQISGSKKRVGEKITIAMMQSLTKKDIIKKVKDKFGIILVDECHHIPAKTFRKIIVYFNSYYLYGLTATPKRKYNDEKLIFMYIGDIIAELDYQATKEKTPDTTLKVIIRETDLELPFDYRIDNFQTLSKILTYDCSRNKLIVDDIISQLSEGKKILILTERKEHVDVLNLYLKEKFELITITGDDSLNKRKLKMQQIRTGDFQVLISTGQFFGEGMDIEHLDCLFLVYPFSFAGKLTQYIGRIQRSSNQQIIFDYRDKNIEYLEKLFKQRKKYYKRLKTTGMIKPSPESVTY